ncbi:MAG: amidohydrolase family protein [Saprospiraceae bacterium]|nr:amidohydrolase family protein [Saprospiraceae bacterium]
MRINAHGHVLPEPDEIPRFFKEKNVLWIDNDRSFMRNANWARPITDDSFFLDEKFKWMEENNIDHEVILNLSQLYCNGMERQLAQDVIRFQNDYNARIMHEHPDKLTCGFVVQPLHLNDALREVERCVEQLKMPLLCLPSHYSDLEDNWYSVADEKVDPIWELADKYGLAVEIHPYDGDRIIKLRNEYWRFHLIWMCALTADTYHVHTLRGLPDKFENTRVCYAHGNQFGQVNFGRRLQGFKGRPDLFEGTRSPEDYKGHDNIYFDTLVHDVDVLKLMLDRHGVSQIVAGLDDPYPLGEMATVENCFPGKVLQEALDRKYITHENYDHIWYDNICRWLNKSFEN